MKLSMKLILLVGVPFVFLAILASQLLPSAQAQKASRPARTSDLTRAAAAVGDPTVLINELDADQTGTDSNEFVELKTTPGGSLTGYVLVFYNGSNDLSYAAYDLDGLTGDANGLVTVGSSTVPGVDLPFPGATDQIQNGQDAVALYLGDATSFPNNTPVTTANVVDAVVYDTSDADDPGLLVLLNPGPAQVQIDENGGGTSTTVSIQRCGSAARDGRAFILGAPSASAVNSACPVVQQANADFNGDGRTDYAIVRQSGGAGLGASPNSFTSKRNRLRNDRMNRFRKQNSGDSLVGVGIEWWVAYNNAPGGLVETWGDFFGDFIVSADFDGDTKDDFAIWRPGAPLDAGFFSINSSDNTFRFAQFGQDGDDPLVVGDYDGDGKSDPATFRCPDTPGTCYFFYRGSLNNPTEGVTYIPWGFGTLDRYIPNPGDYNGDGKYDFCLQDLQGSPVVFWIWFPASETWEGIQWGLGNDFIAPGDYDGDGRSDLAVFRYEGENIVFYILERDGNIRAVQWGVDTDIVSPGDYDGDGRQDIAVFRPNLSGSGTFWVLPSNGSAPFTFNWGLDTDEPVAAWYVQ